MFRWLLVLAFFMGGIAWADAPLKIFPLRHRFAQDLLPSIQPLVGEDGAVSAVGNNLLVRATPARLAEIEQVILLQDVERQTVRITIRRSHEDSTINAGIGVAGSVGQRDATVQVGRWDGRDTGDLRVDARAHADRRSERSSEFVSVLEGERAFISVGQSIPFTETWSVLTRRHVHVQQRVQFHEIATGFTVRPRAIGDEYEVEIAPRIASFSGGAIVFEDLVTTVRVHPGQWLDLGGAMQARDEVSREIFSGSSVRGEHGSALWIQVQ